MVRTGCEECPIELFSEDAVVVLEIFVAAGLGDGLVAEVRKLLGVDERHVRIGDAEGDAGCIASGHSSGVGHGGTDGDGLGGTRIDDSRGIADSSGVS